MKPLAVVSAVLLGLLVAFVFICAPMFGNTALAIDEVHWEGNPIAPCFINPVQCGGHLLGSDENGRDVVARLIVGGRVTLGTALLALLIALAGGFGLSLIARKGGRIVASIVLAVAEGVRALPRVPFALVLAVVTFSMLPHGVGVGLNTFEIAAYYGFIFWPVAFLRFREGASRIDIARGSIGDLMTILLVSSTIEFFGYGHMPPTPTWGNMLANAESTMEIAWWSVLFPGICISLVVLLLEIVRRGLPCGARPSTGSR